MQLRSLCATTEPCAVLLRLTSYGMETEYPLREATVTIGRKSTNGICLDDMQISKVRARAERIQARHLCARLLRPQLVVALRRRPCAAFDGGAVRRTGTLSYRAPRQRLQHHGLELEQRRLHQPPAHCQRTATPAGRRRPDRARQYAVSGAAAEEEEGGPDAPAGGLYARQHAATASSALIHRAVLRRLPATQKQRERAAQGARLHCARRERLRYGGARRRRGRLRCGPRVAADRPPGAQHMLLHEAKVGSETEFQPVRRHVLLAVRWRGCRPG